MRHALWGLFVVPAIACVDMEPENLGENEQAIEDGSLAVDWMIQRAVKPEYPCTATLIAPYYALTAAHCTAHNNEGELLRFYTVAAHRDDIPRRSIDQVFLRPGFDPVTRRDENGTYSDIAILRLNDPAPSTSVPATLAWSYAGPGTSVIVVGAGNHRIAGVSTGNDNDVGELRYRTGTTDEAPDPAMLSTVGDLTDGGDSGGPLYVNRKITGVVRGSGLFTSVPVHLDWILAQTRYAWPFGASLNGFFRSGSIREYFYGATERTCQYACQHSPCEAYNFHVNNHVCFLMVDIGSLVASASYRTNAK